MKKWSLLAGLAATAALLMPGAAVLAQDEGEAEDGPSVIPVEIYACSYHEGKGGTELDGWVEKWTAWAEGNLDPYSAWTLTPFYYGTAQDFDFLWLGVSPNAATLGRAHDQWLAQGSALAAEFESFAHCNAHGNFATMNIKQPPQDDAKTFVLNFSDCSAKGGKTFDDVYPALQAWSEYRTGHGSGAGMWVMWPAFGGGEADFEFKFAVSYRSYEALGNDYDQYAAEGYKKAEELFSDLLDCDEARSYVAMERWDGWPEEE